MEATRFFIACLIQALEDVHAQNVIHKDVKPANLVFDRDGYLRLTDFGVSRPQQFNNSHQRAGTVGYMAPEVICRQNHGKVSDVFAIGVMVHEIMLGKKPYTCQRSREEYKTEVQSFQAEILEVQVPTVRGWTMEAADFANKCLKKNPSERIGARGMHELK